MRLLDRYLLRELLVPLGYCLGGILILYISFSLATELNDYQRNNLRAADVLELYSVRIPGDLMLLLPITLLLASLYALTNHARHHELTAMRAAGVSLWRICVPYVAVGILLSLALLAVNELWLPDSKERQEEIMQRRLTPTAGVRNRDVAGRSGFVNTRDGHSWNFDAINFNTGEIINPTISLAAADGSERKLVAARARWLNGTWTFFGFSTFSPDEISNLPALAGKLNAAADEISLYLRDRLSPATRQMLSAYADGAGRSTQPLQKGLTDDFNRIIRNESVYDVRRFAGVNLSPEASFMLEQKPEGNDLAWLNRTLVLDAYPKEMAKTGPRAFSVHVAEYGTNMSAEPQHPIQTNLLVMPELTETPGQIRREIKFSARLSSMRDVDKATEMPAADIMEFLKLHPTGLTGRQTSGLYTQLYGRLAAPWTCLVAVLIAIPFGAASGRRNLFVGVAGSIVIFFAYFVLLKIGLAVGFAGWLAPWLAAWLPNISFGIAGLWLMLRVR